MDENEDDVDWDNDNLEAEKLGVKPAAIRAAKMKEIKQLQARNTFTLTDRQEAKGVEKRCISERDG